MILRLPRGYARIDGIAPLAVAHERSADAVKALLQQGTLFEWAASHPDRREYQGRGPVFSAPLPGGGPRVVVRHARRGGLLAPLLRDVYLPPTPAPAELLIAAILARAGVPTPPMVAFATYRALGVLRRADVVTVEVDGPDLATALERQSDPAARPALQRAVAGVLGALLNAGAWHQDLNAKNILIMAAGDGAAGGVVLDVDRVRFVPPGDPHVRAAHLARLRRSMEKRRARGQAAFDEADFSAIEGLLGSDEAVRASSRATALQDYMP
jgi:3-deoxy-D-manno-octulosonic acid kinase